MKRNRIRLTETDLHRIVKEAVKRIVREDMKYGDIVNNIGTDDVDDEYNVAAETEKKEELEHNIWDVLTNLAGGDPRKRSFDFQDMVDALSVDFGFDFTGSDDEKECHHFTDGNYDLVIYPSYYYPKQGELRIFNLQIF